MTAGAGRSRSPFWQLQTGELRMRPYFQKMPPFGQILNPGRIKSMEQNAAQIKQVEADVQKAVEKVKMPLPEENQRVN
jgi:hypothetical protein